MKKVHWTAVTNIKFVDLLARLKEEREQSFLFALSNLGDVLQQSCSNLP